MYFIRKLLDYETNIDDNKTRMASKMTACKQASKDETKKCGTSSYIHKYLTIPASTLIVCKITICIITCNHFVQEYLILQKCTP